MFYLLGWNHPLRSGLGDFMSSRDLLINRDLEYLGHLVCTLSAGHHTGDVATVIRLQLKMMIQITRYRNLSVYSLSFQNNKVCDE